MDPRNSQGPDRVDYREAPGDLTEVHAAIQREHRDPSADSTPIPLWLTAVCGAALVWAGGYFMTFHGGFRPDVFNERLSSPEILFPTVAKSSGGAGGEQVAAVSLAQAGKSVFGGYCQACHQAGGQGVPGQFPTLVGTEYVKSEKRIIAIILKGVQGPLNVNGTVYNGAMPPQGGTLNDKKVAQVASYVRASFGNTFPEIDEAKVAAVRKEYAARAEQFTEAELMQMSGEVSSGPSAVASAGAPAQAGAAPAAGGGAPAPAAAPAPSGAELLSLGKAQYAMVCQACHQPSGLGMPGVFPPLAKSEWVSGDPRLMVAIVLKGLQGPITVDGKQYANMMPPQGMVLDDKKIAAIATYVRQSFGNNAPEVSPQLVTELRKQFADRAAMWTEAELKAAFAAGAAPAGAPAP